MTTVACIHFTLKVTNHPVAAAATDSTCWHDSSAGKKEGTARQQCSRCACAPDKISAALDADAPHGSTPTHSAHTDE